MRKQHLNISAIPDLFKFSDYDYEKKIFVDPYFINEFDCPYKL